MMLSLVAQIKEEFTYVKREVSSVPRRVAELLGQVGSVSDPCYLVVNT